MLLLLDKTDNSVKHNVKSLICSRITVGKCSLDIQKARHGECFLDFDCSHKFANKLCFLYKQLGSDPSPQTCLYFQNFKSSKLLNGCLVV